ncbi:wall-associated receptor kinase 2-like [Fagus crenata]
MLVQVTWVWVGVILSEMAAAAAIPFPLALPGCPDRCGDLEIPYPFGTTEGCYLSESGFFFIDCSNSSGQAQPTIGAFGVTDISIQGSIDIMMNNAIGCYDMSDIDECKGPNNCTDKQTCVNDPGSYHCSCIGGYHLDGEACVRDQPPGQSSLGIKLAVEEIHCLLNAPTHSFNIDVGISCSSNRRTAGYDSMGNQTLTPLDGGR